MNETKPKLAYSVDEAIAATGLTRTGLYQAIAAAQIQTFKVGKRRMVSARALQEFIDRKEAEARRDVA